MKTYDTKRDARRYCIAQGLVLSSSNPNRYIDKKGNAYDLVEIARTGMYHVVSRGQTPVETLTINPPPKPAPPLANFVQVGAYTPAGEEYPVLVLTAKGLLVGTPFRKGEEGYNLLKEACNGNPVWMFGHKPETL